MAAAPWLLSALLGTCLAAQTEVRVATGIAPRLNVFDRIREAFEKDSGLKLVLVDARSTTAWELLDKGQVDAAAAALPWEDWRQAIHAQGLRVPDEADVRIHAIGSDHIQILNHLDIVVLQLDKAELAGIFTGKNRNWKEFCTVDAPIQVVIDARQTDANAIFRAKILDGAPYLPEALPVPEGRSLLETVESTPFSIGFSAKATIRSLKVNSPITPDVPRPILLLVKGQKPSPAVKKLLSFLSSRTARKLVVD